LAGVGGDLAYMLMTSSNLLDWTTGKIAPVDRRTLWMVTMSP
jgi:hypothetical protein